MTKRILCFGDSNTWGATPTGQPVYDNYAVRFPSEVRWTGRLQQLLSSDYRIIEEGHNGRTTVFADQLQMDRNGIEHIDVCLETHEPLDLVVVMLGTNDLKPRTGISAYNSSIGIGMIIKKILQNPRARYGALPKILIISPIEIAENIEELSFSNEFGGRIARTESLKFAALFEEQARYFGCSFLDAAKVAGPGEDGIHLDEKGHAALADAVADKIREIL
ncbi:hydrolase [Clostridia bacterium]|nr:hydrolase [Clostridia bacterium]